MPIKAYVGQPRSGKSYEVVSNVILNGLRDGRRVVSNIAGLNFDLMREMLINEGVKVEKIGQLINIHHDEVEKPSFWMTDKDIETGFKSYLQPGDLLVLDEVWRFWKKRGDINERTMNFMRMHGHFPHPETGLICEVALISQQVTDINENIRGVIQETYKMTKLTVVGSNSTYRIDIYSTGSAAKSNFIRQEIRKYNKKYFPLYKSHSQQTGASAVEKNIDDRGNILKSKKIIWAMPLALIAIIWGVWKAVSFFSPAKKENAEIQTTQTIPGMPAHQPAKPNQPTISDKWRLVGWYEDGGLFVVTLESDGVYRLIHSPKDLKIRGWQQAVRLPEGGFATSYSGVLTEQRTVVQ